MRASTNRRIGKSPVLAMGYDPANAVVSDDPYRDVVVRLNLPEQRFDIGDRVRMCTGLQEFNVVAVDFCAKNGRYLVHAKFGPCHFFRWQEDVEHVAQAR